MLHVLVADKQTVRVFEAGPAGGRLAELAVFHNRGAVRHERDLTTSRPGRVMNRAAGVRQSYDPKVSARQYAMQRWLKLLGVQLQLLLVNHRSEAVVLVAAPRMLAELRRYLPPKVRTLVQAEVARDLAKQSTAELTKRLQPAIRAAARSAPGFQPINRLSATRLGGQRT